MVAIVIPPVPQEWKLCVYCGLRWSRSCATDGRMDCPSESKPLDSHKLWNTSYGVGAFDDGCKRSRNEASLLGCFSLENEVWSFSHLFLCSYPSPLSFSLLQFAWGCSWHELLSPSPETADVELLHTTQTGTRTQTQHATPPTPFSLPRSPFPGFEISRNSFPFYSQCVHSSTRRFLIHR